MLKGEFIGVKERSSVFELEKNFVVKQCKKALLRATALGLYFAEVNGKRVGDAYLTPGWTSYNKMLQVQEYDITHLLQDGENNITLTVGEGWYCGRLTWGTRSKFYGEQSAVCAQIELDGEVVIATDCSWMAHESVIREGSIYNGETTDLTAEIANLTPFVIDFNKKALVKQMCEPVRVTQKLAVKQVIVTPKGETVYDFGQNLAGIVEVVTPEDYNGTLTLYFAEILVDGNFYTDNLRSAKATDKFTCKGKHTFSPEFTFHGFRYVKLEGDIVPSECVTALVRHTDMKRTGYISTSNPRFNRLYENVIWGQRGNFVDIPTDCPQRDERLGWTGDINAFCTTAAYNFDVRNILKKWLADLRNDQSEKGEIPFVAPDVLSNKHTDAMWCDAITMVPWAMYRMYGDVSFLADNYSAMKKFISARESTMTDGLICRGHEFGDWLALDVEMLLQSNCVGRTDTYFLTNVLHFESLRIVAQTAAILGDTVAEKEYLNKREALLKCIQEEYFTKSGRFILDTVTAQTVALHFGIVPQNKRAEMAKMLNDNVIRHLFRMTTGFIGSPFILFVLADNGYFETARRLILNNAYPGWLYEVDMGATTIWERWNSLMPDGTPNPEGMNSYNHYAYGSVMEFVYRRIAGIEAAEVGFKKIKIAPMPIKGFPKLYAEYQSVNGKIVSSYEQKDGKIVYNIVIPQGVQAEIWLPNQDAVCVGGGSYTYEQPCENLYCEAFTPESAVIEIFENPKALQAFNSVFNNMFAGKELYGLKNTNLQVMAEYLDAEGKVKLCDFPDMLARANEIFKQLTQI